MQLTQDNYPIFEANQVLTNTHLNQVFNYLDEQERLTRANLIGIGITCGLEMEIEFDATTTTIHISKGCGITSEGYLIMEPDVDLVSYREYNLPTDLDYQPLKNKSTNPKVQYQLWELFPSGEPDTTPLGTPPNFLKNKAVLLFCELKKADLRNCSPNSCDDKGAEVTVTVRRLLISVADLNNILNEAAKLETVPTISDLESTLLKRLNLPDLRLPRYKAPNTGPVTSLTVMEAFLAVIQKNKLVENTIHALELIYTTFQPVVQSVYPNYPFNEFKTKFGFLANKPTIAITAAQVQFLQYYYDFFDDLFKAYDEFRWKGVELMCACCPPEGLFPRHLMVGALFPEEISYRHRHLFLASSAISGCEERRKELIQLFRRMVEMITQFTDKILPKAGSEESEEKNVPTRITPSKLADVPLSGKAIPYYYQQKGTPPLFRLWSVEKDRRNRANQNLSYRSDEYSPEAPLFVTDSLSYDLEPYNFLRIEGGLGKKYQPVMAKLLELKSKHRLPIEILALRAGKAEAGQTSHDLLQNFLVNHPGIQHKAGVPMGGTFILVYRGAPSNDDSSGTDDLSKKIKAIEKDTIIADFFLPYRVVESDCFCQVLVRECEYEWIDSVRHINNLSLRDYRYTVTPKAPAANEAESVRLKDFYVIRIYRYEIQGRSMLPANVPVDILVPIEGDKGLKKMKLSAVAQKLNETFPVGLVFDHKPGSNKLLIRRMEGQNFRLELGGIQGNQIRYAYQNDKVYRRQDKTWEELDQLSDYGVVCRVLGGGYQEGEYKWLHENYQPLYPTPAPGPTAKEAIEWEQMILLRARRYKIIDDLPIYEEVLLPLANSIRQIIDLGERVVLVGSWANGSWVSPDSAKNEESIFLPGDTPVKTKERWLKFIQLRERVTGKTGYSDIDLLIDSVHEVTPDRITVSTRYRIHILKGKKDSQKGMFLISGEEI